MIPRYFQPPPPLLMPSIDAFFAPTFDRLPSRLRDAITEAPLPSLATGPHVTALADVLQKPTTLQVSSGGEDDSPLPSLALSGLWLLAGDLDRSHTISQDDSSAAGSFWHGIMHRREGDYSNAGYWFRRVGSHPVVNDLAGRYADDYGDPYRFINAVETACKKRDADRMARLQQIQWTEWQLLLQDCMLA